MGFSGPVDAVEEIGSRTPRRRILRGVEPQQEEQPVTHPHQREQRGARDEDYRRRGGFSGSISILEGGEDTLVVHWSGEKRAILKASASSRAGQLCCSVRG